MKLSTSNTFDVSQIADTQTYQDIQPFFDFSNTFTSDVVQGFNKQITFKDNVDYTSLDLTVQHGTPINIGNYNPIGVFIKSEIPILYYELFTNSDSTKQLLVYFKEVHNSYTRAASWIAGTIVRYTVLDASPYNVGDVVKISSFGGANNNGNFLITEVNTTSNYLYVINRNRTSATDDELKTGFTGTALAKHSITIGLINA